MPLRKLLRAALAVISVAALATGLTVTAAPAATAASSCDYVTNGLGFKATVTAPVALFVYNGSDCSLSASPILEAIIFGSSNPLPYHWEVDVTDYTCDAKGATFRMWYTDGVQFHLDSLGCKTTHKYNVDPTLIGTPEPNNWWLEVTCSSPCRDTNSHAYPLPPRKPF